MVYCQPDKFGHHKHCDVEDLIIFISPVTLCNHVFKGPCDITSQRQGCLPYIVNKSNIADMHQEQQ